MTTSRPEVVLITRVRTNNKGNQALSSAWLAMLQQAFPAASVRAMERRPPHFLQYTLADFAAARDPFRRFDEVTTRLARLAPGPGGIAPPSPVQRIELDERIAPQRRFAQLRQRLNLRRWAARAGRYRDDYRRRLAACQRAQLVVVNPAGEFFPEDPTPALYHLLDVFVAHKLGRPAAIVNHTLDVADPTLRALIPRIYRELALVGFRDEKSVAAFREMGGDLGNVLVTPDLALMTRRPDRRSPERGRVALAVHAPAASWMERPSGVGTPTAVPAGRGFAPVASGVGTPTAVPAGRGFAPVGSTPWLDVITGLRGRGFDVVLVSNEMPADQAFFAMIRQRAAVSVAGAGLDHDRYCELLGTFDFVVSSRMHTSILAMVAGTPVIPVEGPSFKISGLFAELGFTTPVIQSTAPGWTDKVIEAALQMRNARDACADDVAAKIGVVRERITAELLPRLQQAVKRA